MGDTGDGVSTKGGGDTVGGQVHRPLAGNSVAVGGPAATSGGLKMRDEI